VEGEATHFLGGKRPTADYPQNVIRQEARARDLLPLFAKKR